MYMKKPMNITKAAVLSLFCFFALINETYSQAIVSDSMYQIQQIMAYYDSIDASIDYQTGNVPVKGVAEIQVPEGYKFIPTKDARMIVEDLWGNPEDPDVVGMLVKSDYSIGSGMWAFVLSYEESGYVKDEDADDIDYDEMLEAIQENEEEVNKERAELGYESAYVLDWAVKPFYDKERKILHWAKKIQFGDEVQNDDYLTLNYDVRFLGRKGVLSMNAVGTMDQLDSVNNHIPDILSSTTFNKGYAYSDFNPSVDKVAAYTIGGLIAGKLLAKTGIFVLLLKNIKLIILALIGFFGAFRKKIAKLFSRNKDEDYTYNAGIELIDEDENKEDADNIAESKTDNEAKEKE